MKFPAIAVSSNKVNKKKSGNKSNNKFLEKITKAGDRLAFSWPVRESLYRHLSAQISNRVPTEEALDNFRARLLRRKKVSSEKIIDDISRRMRDGSTLAAAMQPWVPREEVGIISSGETSGNLPKAFDLVIEAKLRIARVNSALKSSMVSPMIYTIAIFGMVWAIGRYVTPGLEQALPKERAHGLVYGLYAAGDFANSLWALSIPIALATVLAVIIRSLPKWTGPTRINAENFFPYSFYRDINGYTWLMGFSALLRAGVTDVEILARQKAHSSPWLHERLHAIWWRMDNGMSLSAALLTKGKNNLPAFGFPNPDIVDDIASMSEFEDFPERISLLAIQWAEGIESSTLAKAKVFGFAMEIFMYVVMGILMLAINDMSTQIGTATGM